MAHSSTNGLRNVSRLFSPALPALALWHNARFFEFNGFLGVGCCSPVFIVDTITIKSAMGCRGRARRDFCYCCV